MKSTKCKKCDKIFQSWPSQKRKYCSIFCKREASKIYFGIYWCENCNCSFINNQNRHPKYCSHRCCIDAASKRYIGKCLNCNKNMKVFPYLSKIGQGKYCSKKCQTQHCVGERASGWKGGVTPIHLAIRMSMRYKNWRLKVFRRDDFRCTECGLISTRKTPINADHIKPFSLYPKLRFITKNGRTLCVKCHRKTDTYGSKIIKKYHVKSILGTIRC